jgi:DNA adenine methylase
MTLSDLNPQSAGLKLTAPALRYHGGKFRLASWILEHFPAHRCYVEPFGGAASVLLKKPRSYAEVYNDLDGDIVNFFRVLRDPEQCRQLIDLLKLTPYAREEFEMAYKHTDDSVERARRVAVRAQMGFGSAGATKGTTGFRVDTKRPHNTSQHLWQRYPDHLAAICDRFQGVLIENRDAIEVMFQHDAADTLHFVDPPYVLNTRVIRSGIGYYRHEMTLVQHIDLLTAVKTLSGKVLVSGYECDLYRDILADWKSVSKQARASAYRGTKMATENLWLNPALVDELHVQGVIRA